MQRASVPSRLPAVAIVLAAIALAGVRGHAQTETVIYNLPGGTGGTTPYAGLIFDSAGNLYSTAYLGGPKNYGSVFALSPTTGGGWQGHLLHSFTGKIDGGNPTSTLIRDARGNLFGTTNFGGNTTVPECFPSGCGVVFELSPAGGGWRETVLNTFVNNGIDGAAPNNDLVMDASGNVYGTTNSGGANGQGTAFRLSHTSGAWHETILHAFSFGKSGSTPFSGMIFDAAGNLYGTTAYGGNPLGCIPKNQGGCGVVYELTPSPTGAWHEQVLYAFSGPDGAVPVAPLISDAAGNLYGTTQVGGLDNCSLGSLSGCGVVFELSPKSGGGWQETVLYAFTGGADGAFPTARLRLDAAGNLYGTATRGGNLSESQCSPAGCGVVFKLSSNLGVWHETVLHTFTGPDGAVPGGNVILDASGNLFGTASIGGSHGEGVVFELKP